LILAARLVEDSVAAAFTTLVEALRSKAVSLTVVKG